MNIKEKKTEIINWIDKSNDEVILENILALKQRETSNLKSEILNAISINEARKITNDFIEKLILKYI